MVPLTSDQLKAAAAALNRAADHFDTHATQMDEIVKWWRKDRPRDFTPIEAKALHGVARQLRQWADRCREE